MNTYVKSAIKHKGYIRITEFGATLNINKDPVHFVLPWYPVPNSKLVIMGNHTYFK